MQMENTIWQVATFVYAKEFMENINKMLNLKIEKIIKLEIIFHIKW